MSLGKGKKILGHCFMWNRIPDVPGKINGKQEMETSWHKPTRVSEGTKDRYTFLILFHGCFLFYFILFFLEQFCSSSVKWENMKKCFVSMSYVSYIRSFHNVIVENINLHISIDC